MPDVSTGTGRLKPELDAALAALPGGIGSAIPYVKAVPLAVDVLREVVKYADVLPEEIIEEVKAVLDIADGGDGAIYR